MASGNEDRVMIFTDKIVFDDRTLDAPESSRLLSAELNYNAADPFWSNISDIEASVSFGHIPKGGFSMSALIDFLLIGIMLLIFIPLLLRMSGLKDKYGGPAQLVKTSDLTATLDDVAGLDMARDQFREIVGLIKSNGKIGEIGAQPPKGVLLQGPPGTGKTLLARAMAKEAGVSFLTLNASRLHEMFVGVGPKRVEDAFQKAHKNAPCIIFIDEVDAVGSRGDGGGRADQERANLINTFLQMMDGLTPSSGIFIVGATNRPDKIDPAFVRPGRIDRKLTIGLPDRKARQEILELHAKKLPVESAYDFGALAGTTPGMSGAELATLINEAGIAAGRDGAKLVGAVHFAHARQKMMLGETGSVTVLSDEERVVTAWHEAGHAIAATLLPHADPVEHATILPHGGSLGHVLQVPKGDRHMTSRASLMDRMTVLAAGRAAEMHKFGPEMVTNGAASDIDALTRIATAIVTQWGMGRYGFLKVDQLPGTTYPEAAMKEIRILSRDALEAATSLLEREKAALTALSAALLERDMLSGEEVRTIIEAHVHVDDEDLKLIY
ncbi:AAA family ATPase [Epibacterium sp. DP7N7-1]|nr:AAA family ATPase [Epibacterium sp. DP7N7-1]